MIKFLDSEMINLLIEYLFNYSSYSLEQPQNGVFLNVRYHTEGKKNTSMQWRRHHFLYWRGTINKWKWQFFTIFTRFKIFIKKLYKEKLCCCWASLMIMLFGQKLSLMSSSVLQLTVGKILKKVQFSKVLWFCT